MPVTPHIAEPYAPLDALVVRAIRRFGDFGAMSVDGEVSNMFIEFANMVIDDVVIHPYYDGNIEIKHYVSVNDIRPVADQIMLAGLLAHYSFQQASEKTQGYQALYYRTMNMIMWTELNGNTAINMRPTDGGSNKAHSVLTNVTNGLEDTDNDLETPA